MTTEKTIQNLPKLLSVVEGGKNLLIVMQDNPDPDGIAAAVGLRELANTLAGVPCSLAHAGIVGRAENLAMVRYLNLNLRSIDELDTDRFELVAFVDTQPGSGNNQFPVDRTADIVIDHHPIRGNTRKAAFTDIRSNYGATATILYEYMKTADIPMLPYIATALLYGIRSDTQDLGREACKADADAFVELYRLANRRMLAQIIRASVPADYFQAVSEALAGARIYGGCLVSDMGEVPTPDMVAEMADLLLRHDATTWVLCMGRYLDDLRLSIRTSEPDATAGELMQQVVKKLGTGGGHDQYAGGNVPLNGHTREECRKLRQEITQRFRDALGFAKRRAKRLVK